MKSKMYWEKNENSFTYFDDPNTKIILKRELTGYLSACKVPFARIRVSFCLKDALIEEEMLA